MILLALLSIAILVGAFFVPTAVEEYAKEAAVLEPTNLSLESITTNGVRARIQANIRLDGSRVKNDHVRRVGRAATWMVRELGTEATKVEVYLPEYDNILLGTAAVPPLAISIVDGHNTAVDFVAELTPGDAEGIRMIANEWLEGRLDLLRVQGKADIHLKSGIIPLGIHSVSESFTFEAKKLPEVPQYNITKINFREAPLPDTQRQAMAAEVTISAFNKYPVQVDIPELRFEVLVPDCGLYDPYILVAAATTSPVTVRPQSDVILQVHGLIKDLPASLTRACPNTDSSPLDALLKHYMGGEAATVFVRGKRGALSGTPDWLGEILSSITVPVPFPGRTFDNLIRNFSLTDVHFTLPNPLAEPGDPDADPKVSGNIEVIAGLPSEMNFDINVTNVRATADVFYKGKKMGELNLRNWQAANSTKLEATEQHDAELKIQSRIEDAPLTITDADVFSDVVQMLLFGGKDVILRVKALVAVRVETVLGELVLKDVPAEGKIPVKPLPIDSLSSLLPQVGNITVFDTASNSISISATVNITNPTPYTAKVPFINVHVLSNGSIVGEVTAKDLDIVKGNNTNLSVSVKWSPSMGGDKGEKIGRELLSQYLSGFNVTVSIKTHRDSIPTQPLIGEALSKLNITVPAPRLSFPGNEEEGKARFIKDATFHVFSSSATFTLVSPLQSNTVYIEHINATAFYNHTEPVGRIIYGYPFAAPPGSSQTPRLPVEWSIGSGGYEKVRKALGGQLKLDASAVVGLRLGSWRETVWYIGKGIGASIRI
ncbi:Pre-rrna processing protein [Pleurostoma richardsiae]|uniref:Pre-rrna processing protein n=1 Tax=Pleurostoma richardsiae TaxID=41990 RepID=A0AA38VFY7_9PEZI|nr:Pre-rrna processing protein [Pleurostoma richardsiae]